MVIFQKSYAQTKINKTKRKKFYHEENNIFELHISSIFTRKNNHGMKNKTINKRQFPRQIFSSILSLIQIVFAVKELIIWKIRFILTFILKTIAFLLFMPLESFLIEIYLMNLFIHEIAEESI